MDGHDGTSCTVSRSILDAAAAQVLEDIDEHGICAGSIDITAAVVLAPGTRPFTVESPKRP